MDHSDFFVTSTSNVSGESAVSNDCVLLQFSDFVPWNNPDNLISLQVVETFEMIVSVVFLNSFFLISAPTNIISMVVFSKQSLKERINLCLFFQSLADLAYMMENFLIFADRIYLEITDSHRQGTMIRFFLNNNLTGFYGFSWASGFMTMVIACERCFCVVSPLRSQRILKTKSMLAIILVAFVLIVGGFFVVTIRWSTTCIFDPETNLTSLEIYPSNFYFLNKRLIDALDGYVYGIILPGTFIIAVVISTVITVKTLHKMASWRGTSSSAAVSVREVALTRMLIGCSILFIVCTIPGVVLRVLILFVPDLSLGGRYRNTFTFMITLTELFNYVNCSVNFFIYYALGTKYKGTLHSMCGRRKKCHSK